MQHPTLDSLLPLPPPPPSGLLLGNSPNLFVQGHPSALFPHAALWVFSFPTGKPASHFRLFSTYPESPQEPLDSQRREAKP